MTQPAWKTIARHDLTASLPLPGSFDLALAEVDPSGCILSISTLGKQRWGWQKGDRVPVAVLDALGTIDEGMTQTLSLEQGDLSLLGLVLNGPGWLLIGYAADEAPADHTSTFKSLIENNPVLVWRMRADGTVLYADTQAEMFTGYAASHIIGRPFWLEVAHPEDRWKLTEGFRRTVEEGIKTTVSVRFLTQRQEFRLARFYLLPSAPEAMADVEALVLDEADPTEAGPFFLQSEAFYRTFLEQSPMGILHLDAAGMVTFENHAFRQIVGESVDEVWIGRNVADITGLDAKLQPLIRRMLQEGIPMQGEEAMYRRAGGHLTAHLVVHGSPIRQPGDKIVGGVMMIEDVTEQRHHEEELSLRDRYARAEVALREAVLADLNETVFVHEAATILGETARADRVQLLIHLGDEGNCATRAAWVHEHQDEPHSLYVESGVYPPLRTSVAHAHSLHLCAGLISGNAEELFDLTEAEEVIWVPFFDAERLGGFVLFERMSLPQAASVEYWWHSEQRLIERLVRLFETLWSWIQVGHRYRLTVATIDDCLFSFSFSEEGIRRYLFITPQIEALTGYEDEHVLARGEGTWFWGETLVDPDDRDQVQAHDETLRSGRESRLTYRIQHRDGSVRWLSEHATPHRDAAGRIAVSGILTDVTEQKATEEILLSAQEQVASASRLKNTIVATMSHELRTPLGAVNGFAELLADELAEWEAQTGTMLPAQVHEFTEAVRQNARRLLMLADDLFVLSSIESGVMQLDQTAVRLEPLVHHATDKVATRLAGKNVALRIDLEPGPTYILGDAQRIEQVLGHLLSNAAKFTDVGFVAVRTQCADDEIEIEIMDTGIGIGEEYLGKLFTPFLQEDNRLNRRYEGTGLGLALTKRLLDAMGGRIEVESEKGVGSSFRVFLPVAEG